MALPMLLVLIACNSEPGQRDEDRASQRSNSVTAAASSMGQPAEDLIAVCGTCHQRPDPGELPVGIWDTVVFPRMAPFVGLYSGNTTREQLLGEDPVERTLLEQHNIYPTHEAVSKAEYEAIRNWYLERAPDKLSTPPVKAGPPSDLFQTRFPETYLSPPATTLISPTKGGGLIVADINKARMYRHNAALELTAELPVPRGLVDVTGWQAGDFAVALGSFSPTDLPSGSLLQWQPTGPVTLATDLHRPTSVARLDVDQDGRDEVLVTEFGRRIGRLACYSPRNGKEWQREELEARAGAMVVVVDTLAEVPTAYVLFGQGREEIVRYTWSGGGPPRRELVLSFPPSYGSSSLQLVDWNHDAYPDLLYTNGDNADYRSPVKPYHGVRIFAGSPAGTFSEVLFQPLPGAYGATVADFNQDGRLDLAAISFFPDYSHDDPVDAVLLLSHARGGHDLQRLPATGGRPMLLTAGDLDGDGDIDLATGFLAMEPVPDNGRLAHWIRQGLPFAVWENTMK